MNPADQARADAAIDSYRNRSQGDVGNNSKYVFLEGKKYQFFGYANDNITGFHATAYQNIATGNIIIAYRGTDTNLFTGETKAEKAQHALTTLQDIAVDATMVRDAVNPQKAAADAFTAQMLAKAAKQGITKDQVTVAGHSLGGALAQIEAAKYGLAGSTYNAYGARALTDGAPQPGCHVTNYRMANDVVSAASPHVGSMVSLASHDDVQSLRAGRYLDAPVGAPPPNVLLAMRLGDHGAGQYFGSQSPDNVLAPYRFSEASQRYADHQAAFEHFTWDVSHERAELSQALRQMRAHPDQTHLPADIQRQVNEYLALNLDTPLREAIEHNAHVQSTAHSLHDAGDAARSVGHAVHDVDERMASAAHRAGVAVFPVNPAASLVGLAAGEAAHLHGRVADAAGRYVGDQFEWAKNAVEQGAHHVADAAQRAIHDPDVQAAGTNVVNQAVDLYHGAQSAAHSSAGQAVGQAYDGIKYIVSPGIEVVEHAAGQVYDTLTHPGQWFQQSAPAASIPPTSTNADTSSSSSSASSADTSTPSQAMDKHTRMQDGHAAQQQHERIQQAPPHAPHLVQAHSQTHAPTFNYTTPASEKPASVDMQEQARIAQLQQQEQQAQAAREQQQRLAQQHVQLHRQAMDAQQREHEQRHSQDPRSHPHEQRQAAEPMLHTPATTKAPHPLTTPHPLELGDRGVAVQALQQHLQTIGVTDRDGNAIKDDKHYGPRTQQAVADFQRLAGREPTGIADPGTLEALQTHAQFAARQKAQHLAPDRHLADHAQPAPSRSTDAMTQYSAPPRPDQPPAKQQAAPKALEPYSSPTSPLHALYAQTKATIENRGVSMSEERMHQLVGKMAVQGMTTEGKNDFAVKGDTLYAREFDVPYNHFMLDLREPAPSVQSTLQQVQTQLKIQEAELTAMRQQQQQNQYEHPYSL